MAALVTQFFFSSRFIPSKLIWSDLIFFFSTTKALKAIFQTVLCINYRAQNDILKIRAILHCCWTSSRGKSVNINRFIRFSPLLTDRQSVETKLFLILFWVVSLVNLYVFLMIFLWFASLNFVYFMDSECCHCEVKD